MEFPAAFIEKFLKVLKHDILKALVSNSTIAFGGKIEDLQATSSSGSTKVSLRLVEECPDRPLGRRLSSSGTEHLTAAFKSLGEQAGDPLSLLRSQGVITSSLAAGCVEVSDPSYQFSSSSLPSCKSDDSSSGSVAIVAGVIISLVVVGAAVAGIVLYRRRQGQKGRKKEMRRPLSKDFGAVEQTKERRTTALGLAQPSKIPTFEIPTKSKNKQGLPPGWQAVRTDTNEVYYWNEKTDETTWTRPTLHDPHINQI